MLRLSEAGGSHDQTSRQKNKTIQHPAWISEVGDAYAKYD